MQDKLLYNESNEFDKTSKNEFQILYQMPRVVHDLLIELKLLYNEQFQPLLKLHEQLFQILYKREKLLYMEQLMLHEIW